jgi:hypothetical protein
MREFNSWKTVALDVWAISEIKKLPKVNDDPTGEKSPNLVILVQ